MLVSWFAGGEVFRSGCCFNRGHGRIFYFRPGHETYPTYYDENVIRVITNAVRWCAPTAGAVVRMFGNRKPLERAGLETPSPPCPLSLAGEGERRSSV